MTMPIRPCDDPLSYIGRLTQADLEILYKANRIGGHSETTRTAAHINRNYPERPNAQEVMEALVTLGLLCLRSTVQGATEKDQP